MRKEQLPVVIIVDDDPDDQLLLKSAFEDCGYNLRVLAFENGQDLLGHLGAANRRGCRSDYLGPASYR